jgi:hypothetical protein
VSDLSDGILSGNSISPIVVTHASDDALAGFSRAIARVAPEQARFGHQICVFLQAGPSCGAMHR